MLVGFRVRVTVGTLVGKNVEGLAVGRRVGQALGAPLNVVGPGEGLVDGVPVVGGEVLGTWVGL